MNAQEAVLAFAETLEKHMDYISVNSQERREWPTEMARLFIKNNLKEAE